ncbi:hypothetical protein ACJMK2_037038 [Sinanodonta woodiana]|uniref:Uncharacterized protein n=1 Tax=Sinanodonta woodiana TaxID=1069815 RepID=A0ABD3WJ12_SINWO
MSNPKSYPSFQKSGSEDQDFSEKPGHSIHNSQLYSSYISTELPTINRSKANNIRNVPPRPLPRRSRDLTKIRGFMGCLPSCPFSVNFRSELSDADNQITHGDSSINAKKKTQTSRGFPAWKSDVRKDRNGFRRSESYQSLYNNQPVTLSNENSNANVSHNSQNRANKVKNKVTGTESREDNHYDFTPRGYDNFETGVFRRYGQENEVPVDAMAHDNGHHTEDKAPSPHALELKSRHMKQWNRSNNEGQVKTKNIFFNNNYTCIFLLTYYCGV